MKYIAVVFLIIAILLSSRSFEVSAQTGEAIVYKETFGYCTGADGRTAALQTRWDAVQRGNRVGKFGNLKVFSYGSETIGGSVNSDPLGAAEGYTFWYKALFGLTIFTNEFQFDARHLSRVQYEQKLSGVNAQGVANSTRLAFLIGDVWYISDDGVRQRQFTDWESVSLDARDLTYGTQAAIGDLGPEIPENSGQKLPETGLVRAFGVFVVEVNGRVRIDNFTIRGDGSGINTAPQTPSRSRCPLDSPDYIADGTPVPTATPTTVGSTPTPKPTEAAGESQDGGDQLESRTPTEEPPPQLQTPTPVPSAASPSPTPTRVPTKAPTATPTVAVLATPVSYTFCPVAEEGRGVKVRVTKAGREALLKISTELRGKALRDAVIAALLSRREAPLGQLVNIKVGDYNAEAGTLMLKKGSGKVVASKLRGRFRVILDQYLRGIPSGDPVAPLFKASLAGTDELDGSKAICSKELRAVVKAAARRAKVGAAVSFGAARQK